jgi:hypothetical protein
MFCPKCRAEYIPGWFSCNDCDEPLVEELPPLPKWEYVDLVTVYIPDKWEGLAIAKSLLDSAGIRYLAKGEAGREGPVLLQVAREDAEEARALLAELDEDVPPGHKPRW